VNHLQKGEKNKEIAQKLYVNENIIKNTYKIYIENSMQITKFLYTQFARQESWGNFSQV